MANGTPITWEVLVAIVTILGFVATVWWVVDAKINDVRDKLAAHKLHVAETYMSKASGGAAIDRATFAIEKIGEDMKADIVKLETSVIGRIERMENRVFNGNGSSHKA